MVESHYRIRIQIWLCRWDASLVECAAALWYNTEVQSVGSPDEYPIPRQRECTSMQGLIAYPDVFLTPTLCVGKSCTSIVCCSLSSCTVHFSKSLWEYHTHRQQGAFGHCLSVQWFAEIITVPSILIPMIRWNVRRKNHIYPLPTWIAVKYTREHKIQLDTRCKLPQPLLKQIWDCYCCNCPEAFTIRR